MASGSIHERRSIRLVLKVPRCVWCDGAEPLRAHTAVVNDHGALILAPCALRSGGLWGDPYRRALALPSRPS